MALVNIYGAIECAATEGLLDCTHQRFGEPLWALLPRGAAWDREDPVLGAVVAGMVTELSRVDVRGQALRRELDPATTWELLIDWEEMLSLPDCEEPETLEARRAAVLAKLLAQTGHDQSLGYWTGLVEALGYSLEWLEQGKLAMTCEDDCVDVLYDDEWLFVWAVVVGAGADDALLACVMGHQALLETLPLVHLLWQRADGTTGEEVVRAFASTTTGYTIAVGIAGVLLFASADAETWIPGAAPTADNYLAACHAGTQGTRLIIMGPAGKAYYSDDGGSSWTASAAAAVTNTVYGVSRGHQGNAVVAAVGGDGECWRSVDAGATWVAVPSATSDVLYAVTRCLGAMVAVGFDGQIMRSTTSGGVWTAIIAPIYMGQHLYGVSAWALTVIAVGAGGIIKRSTDGGLTWSPITSPTTQDLRAVTSSSSGRWTAAGAAGTLIQSLDDGLTWEVRNVNGLSDLWAAGAKTPSGRGLVGGEDGNIFVE